MGKLASIWGTLSPPPRKTTSRTVWTPPEVNRTRPTPGVQVEKPMLPMRVCRAGVVMLVRFREPGKKLASSGTRDQSRTGLKGLWTSRA